jgi:ABC-type thiamin/hydroxymethylpyrimidine transport system permease subunit
MRPPISTSKLLLFGFLTWLISFVVSVLVVERDGQAILRTGMLKSVMIVIGSPAGAWLVVRVFRQRPGSKHPGLGGGLL